MQHNDLTWGTRLKGMLTRLSEKAEAHRVATVVILLVFSGLLYFYGYISEPHHPRFWSDYTGWWEWHDQARYLRSAQALAEFDFSSERHYYPIGYSLLGALFVKVLPIHPFFIPDLVLVLVVSFFLFLMCRTFLGTLESAVIALIAIWAHKEVYDNLVVPWSTIPTHACTYAVAYLLVFRPLDLSRRPLVIASLCAGFVFLCRPGDLLFLMPVFLTYALSAPGVKGMLTRAVLSVSLVLLFVLGGLALNKLIHGVYWGGPYQARATRIGFSLDVFVLYKLYSLFVEAKTLYGTAEPMLLERFPWILVVVPGIVVGVRRIGIRMGGLAGSIIVTIVFYVSFKDFSPFNIFHFRLIHYLVWILPLLFMFSYVTFRLAWSTLPRAVIVALIAIPGIALCSVGIETEGTTQPLRLTIAPASTLVGFHSDTPITFRAMVVPGLHSLSGVRHLVRVDNDRTLKSILDYTCSWWADPVGTRFVFYRLVTAKRVEFPVPHASANPPPTVASLLNLRFSFGGTAHYFMRRFQAALP